MRERTLRERLLDATDVDRIVAGRLCERADEADARGEVERATELRRLAVEYWERSLAERRRGR